MQQATHPIVKDLVLVGGGHTHAIALRMFGMTPLPGVRLTLITDVSHTPYSGMLPGHVAGFYHFDECHIDLRRLAGFAQAQLYCDRAVGLDLENNRVICANRPPIVFDLLSIDIGSTPATINVPGANEYAIPAKPVPQFLAKWNQLIEEFAQNPEQPISIGLVGGGAGGVELAMTMQRRLYQILNTKELPLYRLQIHLFHRGTELLPGHSSWVRRHLQEILHNRGIQLHLGESVCEVLPDKIRCESGLVVGCNSTFWVTQASAPSWIRDSGLKTNSDGFILVGDTLQSLSHPHVFAAGDIATMVNYPRPKAGVFAVRQGKPLFQNLQRCLQLEPLKSYKPQKWYLSLIGTGDREAIASWGALGWRSRLLWRWKDHIDRKFMNRFSHLPEMSGVSGQVSVVSSQELPTADKIMRCSGCGSKVGSTTLERVLQRLQINHQFTESDDILVGLGTPDDAAVVRVPANRFMVHTVDYFRSLINDPYVFGQISTNHCLSDIFAMGATPQSALAIATIPYATEAKVEETLYQLLSGAMTVLNQAQTPLVGGHTTEGAELALGLSCNGLVDPNRLLKKSGMKPGQVLILTKALGTGTLFAAQMRYQAKGRWIDDAVQSMLLSNQKAATVFIEHGATACTDITGFGLLGHLMEMVKASDVAVELDLEAIPMLDGAIETVQMGMTSSLQPQNLRAAYFISNLSEVSHAAKYPILFDPQTSGGLLGAIASEQADSCLMALRTIGYSHSQIIGRVTPRAKGVHPIALV
ncbi:MAG TPA: selenide, water dikinase SelD [Coleofasciculaceae cyanobacterium]